MNEINNKTSKTNNKSRRMEKGKVPMKRIGMLDGGYVVRVMSGRSLLEVDFMIKLCVHTVQIRKFAKTTH